MIRDEMPKFRDEEFRIDVGSAEGGRTFVRVLHTPSGISRIVTGLAGRSSQAVAEELRQQIEEELGSVKDA